MFTGTSSYSQDLQNVISREVAIASLPIQQLQNSVSQLTAQSSELQTLNGRFSSVQSAITSLSAAAGQTLAASVSDSSVVNASLSTGASAGTYSIDVVKLGSYSNALSSDGLAVVTNPGSQNISTAAGFTLTVNGKVYPPITPSASNLSALALAINSAGAGVQATLVNVGTDQNPDYRLSLQSSQLGPVTMQLNDGSRDLLAPAGPPGETAQYVVNGKQVESGSRSVTLAPGLHVNLTGTTAGTPATITVAPDGGAIQSALQSFAAAYNAAIDGLAHNRGQAGGALAGQSIVYSLTNSLRSLSSYSSGNGPITSLASLGLSFADSSGHLSFDAGAFSAAASSNMDALKQFLGSPDGGGFLQVASHALSGIDDSSSGTLSTAMSSTLSGINSLNQQINTKQDQVNQLQQNLSRQMAAADALLASMQQQATYFNNMFTAIRAAQGIK